MSGDRRRRDRTPDIVVVVEVPGGCDLRERRYCQYLTLLSKPCHISEAGNKGSSDVQISVRPGDGNDVALETGRFGRLRRNREAPSRQQDRSI